MEKRHAGFYGSAVLYTDLKRAVGLHALVIGHNRSAFSSSNYVERGIIMRASEVPDAEISGNYVNPGKYVIRSKKETIPICPDCFVFVDMSKIETGKRASQS